MFEVKIEVEDFVVVADFPTTTALALVWAEATRRAFFLLCPHPQHYFQ
jgi:hypothetical protein